MRVEFAEGSKDLGDGNRVESVRWEMCETSLARHSSAPWRHCDARQCCSEWRHAGEGPSKLQPIFRCVLP